MVIHLAYWLINADVYGIPTDQLRSILNWFVGLVSPQKGILTTLPTSHYGNIIVANFKSGPDYIALLILPVILAVAIPGFRSIYHNANKKLNQKKYLSRHRKIINDAYDSSRLGIEEAIDRLVHIRNDILNDYLRGNIYQNDYEGLTEMITIYLQW